MSKPRPPLIDKDALNANLERSPLDRHLDALRNKLDQLDRSRSEGIPTTAVAFSAIAMILDAKLKGASDAELKDLWPSSWGDFEIALPTALVKELADDWADYLRSGTGKTLGEAFSIEGGGQGGSRNVRRRLSTIETNIDRANQVALEYLDAGYRGNPISLADAQQKVADSRSENFKTIENAWGKFGAHTLEGLKPIFGVDSDDPEITS